MSLTTKPLLLNGAEVEENLPIEELIAGIETSFVQYTTKQEGIQQPQRLMLPVANQNFFLVKPAISLPSKTLAAKLLTYYPENEEKFGIPAINSMVVVFDSETGLLQGVMDGNAVTDLRTAAATAVAVKHLSKESVDTLALIGAGHQAESHIKILKAVRRFKEIRVFCRTKEKREAFAERHQIISCDTIEDAIKNADIIVTATFSKVPLVQHEWVKPGALINIIGAAFPDTREVDDKTMQTSQIFVDCTESSYQKAGDIIGSKVTIHGELGSVINGTVSVDWDKTRVFKSNGLAIQDLVAGRIVVDNCLKKVQSTANN